MATCKYLLLAVVAVVGTNVFVSAQDETADTCKGGEDDLGKWSFDAPTKACLYVSSQGNQKTWSQAQTECEKLKANLVTVKNMEIYKVVVERAKPFASSKDLFWIGLYQASGAWTSVHNWIAPGPVAFFRAWDFNEPNAKAYENCVAHSAESDRWRDANCGRAERFICERNGIVRPPYTRPDPQPGNCQEKWAEWNEACYHFSGPSNKTYEQAYAACTTELSVDKEWPRANLVSIHNSLQNDFIIGEMRRSHYRHRPKPAAGSNERGDVDMFDFWIGLHDNSQHGADTDDDLLVWSDQTAVDWINWHVNEPSTVKEGTCVDFGAEYERVGRWQAVDCNEKRGFVCKGPKKADAPVPPKHTSANCPTDFIPFADTCLKVIPLPATGGTTWSQAQSKCQAEASGANIATIQDIYENAEMRILLRQAMDKSEPAMTQSSAWLGMQEKGGNYAWYNECPVTFTKFENLYERAKKDGCVQMNQEGQWVAVDCDAQAQFVFCEKRIEKCEPAFEAKDPFLYCHPDFPIECGRSCYRVEAERNVTHSQEHSNTIDEARKACHGNYQSRVASIRTKEDHDCLQEYIKYNSQGTWIGLNGVDNKDTGAFEWKWETEKPNEYFENPTTYTGWEKPAQDGTPVVDPTDKSKRCVYMTKDGAWVNTDCKTADLGYICEMRKEKRDTPRWTVTVAPGGSVPRDDDSGLSGGAVAGLVIGVLLLVALVGGIMFVIITGRTQTIITRTKNIFPSRQGSSGNRPLY